MKISICIPQYNRIRFLLYSLKQIELQTYSDIEVIISDDCSSDNTEEEIKKLIPQYKFPIRYHKQITNQGYDKNLRTTIELAQGDYVIIIGNDDTINPAYDLSVLTKFLIKNNYPEVGFTNFIESSTGLRESRAAKTTLLGSGPEIAFAHYSRFSFVGGIIYKRTTYLKHNTSKFDGSVYTQMYHSSLIVSAGGELFSIAEPVVIKDILPGEKDRASYTDRLSYHWKDYKVVNGGLPSVIDVLIASFEDAGVLTQRILYGVIRKIYGSTLPFWVLDYRKNKALPEAVGLVVGMQPKKLKEYKMLSLNNRIKINGLYIMTSIGALVTPVSLFEHFKTRLWRMANHFKN